MSSRTIYTSTITVPIYASWRCHKCDEVNIAAGSYTCTRRDSSSSFRTSKQDAARAHAAELARDAWVDEAYQAIIAPTHNAELIRANVHMQSTSCSKCNTRAQWDRDTRYLNWMGIAFLPAIFGGILAFSMMTSVIAWLIFIASFSVILYGIYTESSYKSMMKTLPTRYVPVFGSLNEELIKYAEQKGKSIPTPEDAVSIVLEEGLASVSTTSIAKSIPEIKDPESDMKSGNVELIYCRKCGTQLDYCRGFCHKCGAEIILE